MLLLLNIFINLLDNVQSTCAVPETSPVLERLFVIVVVGLLWVWEEPQPELSEASLAMWTSH